MEEDRSLSPQLDLDLEAERLRKEKARIIKKRMRRRARQKANLTKPKPKSLASVTAERRRQRRVGRKGSMNDRESVDAEGEVDTGLDGEPGMEVKPDESEEEEEEGEGVVVGEKRDNKVVETDDGILIRLAKYDALISFLFDWTDGASARAKLASSMARSAWSPGSLEGGRHAQNAG